MTFVTIVVLCCVSFEMLSIQVQALESRPCYLIDGSLNTYAYQGFDKFFPCNPDQEVKP